MCFFFVKTPKIRVGKIYLLVWSTIICNPARIAQVAGDNPWWWMEHHGCRAFHQKVEFSFWKSGKDLKIWCSENCCIFLNFILYYTYLIYIYLYLYHQFPCLFVVLFLFYVFFFLNSMKPLETDIALNWSGFFCMMLMKKTVVVWWSLSFGRIFQSCPSERSLRKQAQ